MELKQKENEKYQEYVERMTEEEGLTTSIRYACDYFDITDTPTTKVVGFPLIFCKSKISRQRKDMVYRS